MKGLLKFITCGSVDDGKSTLIGHILYNSKLIYADQEKALILDSKVGSREGAIDYSLLLDGLMAEREQGITIDVAYRYFTTEKRSFIVADTPGHEEYTRNMAVGASFADLAIILVDATQGLLPQTRRHARICKLMGIQHYLFAVNKMDLAGYDEKVFRDIEDNLGKLSRELGLKDYVTIPVSATEGDNVTEAGGNMTWYQGETILGHLESVDTDDAVDEKGFYMPIQRVCRPNHNFRGFQGQIEAGKISVGDDIVIYPSKETANIKGILVGDKKSDTAINGQAVTISLDKEVDVSRGCVIARDADLQLSSEVIVNILWMNDDALDVFGVHGLSGVWGLIATGLFASPAINGVAGLFYGNPNQLLVQIIAVAATVAFAFVASLLIAKVLDITVGLRVEDKEEITGLDSALHKESGYRI